MARGITNKPKRFSLEGSDAIEENERILESGSQQRKENRDNKERMEDAAGVAPAQILDAPSSDNQAASTTTEAEVQTNVSNQPEATSFSNAIAANMRKQKGKKTENGITIYVPMEYYERIVMMKMRTGVPIKDLALQAVIEFLDRNK